MIFIIDIDCCVFFWFQGAFFFGGMGLRRWGLAFEGQVGFGRLDRFFFCWLKWIKWNCLLSLRVESGLARIDIEIYWNILKSLKIVEAIRVLLETLIHDGAFGDGAEVQKSAGSRWGDSKEVECVCCMWFVCVLHGVLIRTWTYSWVFSIQTKHKFFWAKKTYDTSKSGIRVLSWQGAAPKRAEPLQYGDGFWRLLGFPPSRATPVFFVEHSRNPTGQWTIPELNGGLELGKSCHKWGIFKCYVWLPEGRLKIGMGGLLCSLPQVWKFWVFGLGYLGKDTLVESWQRRFPVISLHVLWMKIGYLPSFFRQIHRVEGTW
jgi:hypothetical protein